MAKGAAAAVLAACLGAAEAAVRYMPAVAQGIAEDMKFGSMTGGILTEEQKQGEFFPAIGLYSGSDVDFLWEGSSSGFALVVIDIVCGEMAETSGNTWHLNISSVSGSGDRTQLLGVDGSTFDGGASFDLKVDASAVASISVTVDSTEGRGSLPDLYMSSFYSILPEWDGTTADQPESFTDTTFATEAGGDCASSTLENGLSVQSAMPLVGGDNERCTVTTPTVEIEYVLLTGYTMPNSGVLWLGLDSGYLMQATVLASKSTLVPVVLPKSVFPTDGYVKANLQKLFLTNNAKYFKNSASDKVIDIQSSAFTSFSASTSFGGNSISIYLADSVNQKFVEAASDVTEATVTIDVASAGVAQPALLECTFSRTGTGVASTLDLTDEAGNVAWSTRLGAMGDSDAMAAFSFRFPLTGSTNQTAVLKFVKAAGSPTQLVIWPICRVRSISVGQTMTTTSTVTTTETTVTTTSTTETTTSTTETTTVTTTSTTVTTTVTTTSTTETTTVTTTSTTLTTTTTTTTTVTTTSTPNTATNTVTETATATGTETATATGTETATATGTETATATGTATATATGTTTTTSTSTTTTAEANATGDRTEPNSTAYETSGARRGRPLAPAAALATLLPLLLPLLPHARSPGGA